MTESMTESNAPLPGASTGVGGASPGAVTSPAIEIIFRVEYKYDPELSEPCRARIVLYLPCEEGTSRLNWLLIDPNTKIFERYLSSLWGYEITLGDRKYRFVTDEESAKAWEELLASVQNVINSVKLTLSMVKNKNILLSSQKPENYTISFSI